MSQLFRLQQGEKIVEVRLEKDLAFLDGRPVSFRGLWREGTLESIELAGEALRVRFARHGDTAFVWCAGGIREIRQVRGRASRVSEQEGDLLSPMPGRIRRTLVASGERVKRGQVVMILEAMKMEHAIRAPKDGVITRLPHREGDLVEAGVALAEIT